MLKEQIEIDGKTMKDWKVILHTGPTPAGLINLAYGENNIYDVKGPVVSPAFHKDGSCS